ncbi:MAG: ribulose 1,5-bisphosphate carboxylase [Candidatus Eremiobacteraeota bacterium]|nr:ribulose 1,5-bisphosphate carboxylase [Candidatus Eremiobacteraeota bacterium]
MRFLATYEVRCAAQDVEARAQAIAFEQSVECPLAAIHEPRIVETIVGRVERIEHVDEQRHRVTIALAAETVADDCAQFVNMAFGNASLWDDVRFVGLELPPAMLAAFAGPRHGLAGLRTLLQAPRRALTSAAMKPQGLDVDALARMAETLALGGIDVIKDDHGIADQLYAPFPQRVVACHEAVQRAVQRTGRPVFYAPHLIGTPRALRRRAELARETGVRVVLVAPMLVGLPAFRDLVDEFPDFVYLAHPSFSGATRIAPPLLFGRLLRLFGADAPIFVNYGGRFGLTPDECRLLADEARAPWGAITAACPVPAGGMRLERIPELLAFYGSDVMLLVGGDLLLAQGDALQQRARGYVAAVHDVQPV